MPEKWIPFWLDALNFYMMVSSRDEWKKAVEKYHGNIKEILAMKSNCLHKNYPDFGEGAKYTVSPTLGEWAEANGIDLNIAGGGTE